MRHARKISTLQPSGQVSNIATSRIGGTNSYTILKERKIASRLTLSAYSCLFQCIILSCFERSKRSVQFVMVFLFSCHSSGVVPESKSKVEEAKEVHKRLSKSRDTDAVAQLTTIWNDVPWFFTSHGIFVFFRISSSP